MPKKKKKKLDSQAGAAGIAKHTFGRSRKFKNKYKENKKDPPNEKDHNS